VEIVTKVLNNMRRYATTRAGKSAGQYWIDSLNDEPLDPPAKLRMTEAETLSYVLELGADSEDNFPGSTQEEAGLAYLLIHLDETFATKVGAGTTVTVTPHQLLVTDPVEQEWPHVDPDGEYYWTADRPNDFS
jgi:hypothetical protein